MNPVYGIVNFTKLIELDEEIGALDALAGRDAASLLATDPGLWQSRANGLLRKVGESLGGRAGLRR